MGKKTGIVRKIDTLGRIVIPKEIRSVLDINELDDIEITVVDGTISLKKYVPCCIFCGSDNYVTSFRDKLVCNSCIEEISNI